MSNLLISSNYRTLATKFIATRNVGRFLPHNGHSRDVFKSELAPIFTRTFTPCSSAKLPQKSRYWLYLSAGILTGVSLQQAYAFELEKSPKPISSISSGTYSACYYNPIPLHIVQKMMGKSYKENCPIPISDLAYVKITHYDMNGEICSGELVVHKKIADRVMEIFKDIHAAKFPIEKMRLIDEYDANDDRSMEDNNSSAFCFRSITNRPGVVSNHGLGVAIDINTRLNPYVKGDNIAPSNAQKYVDRSLKEPGMIHPEDAVVKAFKQREFTWGGDWKNLKDYQHFEIDRAKIGITA